MATADVHSEYRCWSVEGHAIRIEYAVPALEEICAIAIDGLFQFRHGGMEVGGVLYGTAAGDQVRIQAYRPLDCEHAFGPRFVLSERDRTAMKELLYAPRREAELRALEPVGWFHSHTRSGIELSPRDLEIYDSYFPQRWQVALVIRPDNYGPARAGFFFRERDRTVHSEQTYWEFTSPGRRHGLIPEPVEAPPPEEPAPAPAPPERPTRRVTAAAAAPPAPVAPVPEPEPAPAPAVLQKYQPAVEAQQIHRLEATRRRRGGKWGWAALALAFVSAAAFGGVSYYVQATPAPALSLWVADMGGQLLIEWDRSARPIRTARSATLEIQDGNQRVTKILDSDVLREGSIDYQRLADVVDVRMKIEQHGRIAQEMVRFIGQPVERGLSPQGAAIARERDALKAEVEALRVEGLAKDDQIKRLRTRLARDQ